MYVIILNVVTCAERQSKSQMIVKERDFHFQRYKSETWQNNTKFNHDIKHDISLWPKHRYGVCLMNNIGELEKVF